MALILADVILAIGAEVGSTLSALGAPTAVSAAASGAVVTGATNYINDAVTRATENIIGKEKLDAVKENINQVSTEAENAAKALYWQDPYFLNKLNSQGSGKYVNTSIPPPNLQPAPETIKLAINPLVNNQLNSSIDNTQPGSSITAFKLIPGEVAKLITDHTSAIAESVALNNRLNPEDTLVKTIGTDSSKLTLAQRLSDYYANKSLPTSDYYNSIANTYNGKNLVYPFIYYEWDNITLHQTPPGPLKKFIWNDETGTRHELVQSHDITVLPSLYGIFGGPSSINNNYPIDLLDSFFCMHDNSYDKEGFASIRGDFQLVSRLTQNKDRLNQTSLTFINSTIAYFSTIANTLHTLKGSLPDEVSKAPIENVVTDDFYGSQNTELALSNPDQFKQEQSKFYKELESEMETAYTDSSIFAQASTYRTSLLAQSFGNIEVELL